MHRDIRVHVVLIDKFKILQYSGNYEMKMLKAY